MSWLFWSLMVFYLVRFGVIAIQSIRAIGDADKLATQEIYAGNFDSWRERIKKLEPSNEKTFVWPWLITKWTRRQFYPWLYEEIREANL